MAYDTDGTWGAGTFPIKTPYQKRVFHQPFERRMPMYCGWKIRMGSHHIPFTDQYIKLFERASRLRWLYFGMLIHGNIPSCSWLLYGPYLRCSIWRFRVVAGWPQLQYVGVRGTVAAPAVRPVCPRSHRLQ